MIEPPEQHRFWSVVHATMDTIPGIIFESFFLKLMLGGFEINAKLLDEGFESGRI
jgi:hypothetical protein